MDGWVESALRQGLGSKILRKWKRNMKCYKNKKLLFGLRNPIINLGI